MPRQAGSAPAADSASAGQWPARTGSTIAAPVAGCRSTSTGCRYHGGLLDLTFAEPSVRIDSATAAALLVTVNGSTVEFGAIDLAAGARSTPNGAVSYTDAPVTLTGAGATAFAGFYAAGITYAAEQFGWTAGTGSYDPATAAGLLGFTGDVRFTGHDGALDTTLANPQIEIVDATTGYLILDVTGTTQTGEVVNTAGVRFTLLDLAAATETATAARIELAGVPATLTAAAAAFGTYPEGEELDPVDVAFSVAAECGTVAVATEDTAAGSAASSGADGDDITPVAASTDLAWLIRPRDKHTPRHHAVQLHRAPTPGDISARQLSVRQ